VSRASHPIPLGSDRVRQLSNAEIDGEVRSIVRSVQFELLHDPPSVRLLGPAMGYHAIDPHLAAALRRIHPCLEVSDILSFHARVGTVDLCFEDSWSGWFIAQYLPPSNGNLVVVHLDDHTDMMPSMLEVLPDGGLANIATRHSFDVTAGDHWQEAILTGVISIGNFLTPLYFAPWRTHVRHLNNAPGNLGYARSVFQECRRYDLIPDKRFAAVDIRSWSTTPGGGDAGTYLAHSDADIVLGRLPTGDVIVHIDLDYFVNDFNGNPREAGPYVPDPGLIAAGRAKLDVFFRSLRRHRVDVTRWVVATSPGFCSGCHWHELLSELQQGISSHECLLR
jgi:hypothetical protein